MNEVLDFINVNRDRYVDELKQSRAIPRISALPQHSADVRRAAEWTVDAIRSAGMQNVTWIDTPGHPVVYGDWHGAPGKDIANVFGQFASALAILLLIPLCKLSSSLSSAREWLANVPDTRLQCSVFSDAAAAVIAG